MLIMTDQQQSRRKLHTDSYCSRSAKTVWAAFGRTAATPNAVNMPECDQGGMAQQRREKGERGVKHH